MISKQFKNLAISMASTIIVIMAFAVIFKQHREAIILVGMGTQVCLIIFWHIYYDSKEKEK